MPSFETVTLCKESRIGGLEPNYNNLIGRELSAWEMEGTPSHGDSPTVFANPTNATQGALVFTNPATGKQKWIHSVMIASGNASTTSSTLFHLFDRLLHVGGFDATITTAQNVNGGADASLTRHYQDPAGAQDVGNEIWLEVYTTVGATETTITCSYKNESGASKTTQAVKFGGTGNRENARFIQLPLAAGDRGVSAVVSVTLAATTGTAGNFGLCVVHRLGSLIANSGTAETLLGVVDESIEVLSGACLMIAFAHSHGIPDDPKHPIPFGMITFVEA